MFKDCISSPAMKKCLQDRDIQALQSKFDINVREEASYVLWYIWRDRRAGYENLQACIGALAEDEGLYGALKLAHAEGCYEAIRQWQRIHSVPSHVEDLVVEAGAKAFLEMLEPSITKLVVGEIVMPVWVPDAKVSDPETVAHLKSLNIPSLKGKPNLLLHDLGSFTRDGVLEKRLNNIFMSNNHTFLVNTSGSGKTRLLLEGLCENWGFYFTSMVDSSLLGSSDVQNSIQTHVPYYKGFRTTLPPAGSAEYDAALSGNREIASRIFRQIFLARLMIFNLFAVTMAAHLSPDVPEDPRIYRSRWLLLQLLPSFVHPQVWDIFDELSCKLSGASDGFINKTTKLMLSNVRTLCSSFQPDSLPSPVTGTSQLSTAETVQTPLFCVLDEAQHAATQHTASFRSDHNGAHRPILREIVKAWEGQSFGQGVFMVVAGTGISKDVVDQAMASAIMKDSRYRWCSDTGAFDHQDVQQAYLQKYLPRKLLQSEVGERLVERIWYWLHGRYRFTTGYVAELILNGFKRPHGLLNAYVEHFTNFKVTDSDQLVRAEGQDALPVLSQYKLDFSKLKKNGDLLTTIHQLTTHYLMRSVLPLTLGKDEAIYVEYGFARFVDSETKTVAVDEPLVLLAATRWINTHHRTSYKFFAKQIHLHDPNSNGFENYIAFCIDMIFSYRRKLSDVFSFVGPAPAWANQDAELISLHRYRSSDGMEQEPSENPLDTIPIDESLVRHFLFSGPSVTLGTNAKSPEETEDWLQHGSPSPICFPHLSMGPDLLFVLRLADKSLIWVALQAKYSTGKNGSLSRPYLRQAMRSVTPSFYFLDKEGKHFSPASHPNLISSTNHHLSNLPRPRTDTGQHSLLRVIASFPAATNLKRCLNEDPDPHGHPIAALNMALIKSITRKLSPIDFLDTLEKGPMVQTRSAAQNAAGPSRSVRSRTGSSASAKRKRDEMNGHGNAPDGDVPAPGPSSSAAAPTLKRRTKKIKLN